MRLFQFLPLGVILFIAGCSFPMDYQTRGVPKIAPGQGREQVAVVGVDDREYLKKKQVDARYVGIFRDLMVAIPYRWVTKSGKPAVDDLALNLTKGLRDAGYKAENVANLDPGSVDAGVAAAKALGTPKILVIRVSELESDTQWRTEICYDFTFDLLSKSGKLIASNRNNGSIMIGASPLPTLTAQNTVPKKVSEFMAEGVKPLLKDF